MKSYFLQGTKNDTVGDYGEKSISVGGDGRANDGEVYSWTKEELHKKWPSPCFLVLKYYTGSKSKGHRSTKLRI